jgi:lysophospholipase L1-like esterase
MAELAMDIIVSSVLRKRAFVIGVLTAALYFPSAALHSQAPPNILLEPPSVHQKAGGSSDTRPPATATSNCTGSGASRNDDWPNLARYREANSGIRSIDVVFMGDSITDLWAEPRFGGFFIGRNYLNRGIGGQTTSQMLLRFRQDVIALKPKAVVILAGTNDIAGNTGPTTDEEIEGNLASMSELAKAAGIKVVLASITPVAASQTPQRPMIRILKINSWMRSYAVANKHVYLDYFSVMVDSRGLLKARLSDDGLHPNTSGYAVMSPMAEAAIASALQ